MAYFAGNLSPIADFMNNNNSPAMDKLAAAGAALTSKENIHNIGLESDTAVKGVQGQMENKLGELGKDAHEYIGNQEFWGSVIGDAGSGLGTAIGKGYFGNPFKAADNSADVFPETH